MSDRFQHVREKYHVINISEDTLTLVGGGSFYPYDNEDEDKYVDSETQEEAEKLALEFGMTITDSHGEWWGWSEYTPDPGDVSVFHWERQ